MDKLFSALRKSGKRSVNHEHASVLTALNLCSETLSIIEKTRLLTILDSPKTNVYGDLSEIKQTVETARLQLTQMSKKDTTNVFNLRAVEVVIQSLNEIKKQLLALEVSVPLDFWTKTKIALYQTDFTLKIQIDQISSMQSTEPASSILATPDAKWFWTTCFSDKTYFVPWKEFYSKLAEATCEDISRDEAPIKFFLDFCRDDQVSPFELLVFLRWFGPLKGCCGRMLDALRTGLLAGFMPAMEANALLENKPAGSFLIRFSKTRPGSFAVTFVDSSKQIKHVLLYSAETGYGMTLKSPPTIYESLKQFASAHASKLKYPVVTKIINELATEASSSRDIARSHSPAPPPAHSAAARESSADEDTSASLEGYAPHKNDTKDKGSELPGMAHMNLDTCVICLDAQRTTVFLECCHMACCAECSKMVTDCPICRQKIQRVVHVFRS